MPTFAWKGRTLAGEAQSGEIEVGRQDEALELLRKRKILGGVALGQFDRTLRDGLMVALTENRSRAEIDAYAEALASVVA